MKIRVGFVSNSSTASFIVQTRPSEFDCLFNKEVADITLPKEKIDLLKKHGFWPTKEINPFARELGRLRGKTEDDTFLTFKISCNHDYVLQFLVANDIPFKAAVHYGDTLYSYDVEDENIYILRNFGMEFLSNPKKLEDRIDNSENWMDLDPLTKISKEEFLEGYSEEESIKIIGEPLPQEREDESNIL